MIDQPSGEHDGCEVIAEAGINHNGQLRMAKEMIDTAAAACDAVKFQTFQPEEVVSEQTQKASYHERSASDDQYEMLVES